MPKYRLTTLSPIHIGSGHEYEMYFNMLYRDGFIYIYDEFKIAQFFISRNINIPSNLNSLKEHIANYKDELIDSNLHIRKIDSSLGGLNKPLLEQVSTQSMPIITGSSIKGAIRTAYIYQMVKNGEFKHEQSRLQDIDDLLEDPVDFQEEKELKKEKKELIRDINNMITDKTKNIFGALRISDTLNTLSTQAYKSINIKKEKTHQRAREGKVEEIANLVESIKPKESTTLTIDISNAFFNDLASVCNSFYQKQFDKEFENYFLDTTQFSKIKLNDKQFLLNIGRFGGAELKSIEEIRSLSKTGGDVDWDTSARTYAQAKDIDDKQFFEATLIPFGWVVCELV